MSEELDRQLYGNEDIIWWTERLPPGFKLFGWNGKTSASLRGPDDRAHHVTGDLMEAFFQQKQALMAEDFSDPRR